MRSTTAIGGVLAALASQSRVVILLGLIAASTLLAAPAGAQLQLLGGTAQRTIELTERVEGGVGSKAEKERKTLPRGDRQPYRIEGTLSLDLRNTSPFPVRLRILYSRPADGSVQVLPTGGGLMSIAWPAVSGHGLRATAARLARDVAAIRIRRRSAGVDAAAGLLTQLSPTRERATRAQLQRLAALISSAVHAPGTVANAPFAVALRRAICAGDRICPPVGPAAVRPLVEAIERTAADERAGRKALVEELAKLSGAIRRASYPVMPAHSPSAIQLQVYAGDSTPPQLMSGTLEIQAYTMRGAHLVGSVSVPITAQVEAFGDVRFNPDSVVIHVVHSCVLLPCGNKSSAAVELIGAGVGRLIAHTTGKTRIYGQVTHEDTTLQVALTDIEGDPSRVDTAKARLVLLGKVDVGKYTGTLPLSQLPMHSPSLKVEVESRKWEGIAALFVAAGVLLSGIIFQLAPWWTQRRAIRKAIKGQAKELSTAIGALPAAMKRSRLVEDLERRVTLEDNKGPRDYLYVSAEDPASVLAAADNLRSVSDRGEVEKWAAEFVTLSRRWAARLEQLQALDEITQDEGGTRATQAMRAGRDLVQATLNSDVPGLAAAPLDLEMRWLTRFKGAWALRDSLRAVSGEIGAEAARVKLADLAVRPAGNAADSKKRRRDAERTLDERISELEALRDRTHEQTDVEKIEAVSPALPVDPQFAAEVPAPAAAIVAEPAVVLSIAATTPPTAEPVVASADLVGEADVVAIQHLAGPRKMVRETAERKHVTKRGRFDWLTRWFGPLDLLVTFAVVIATSLAYTATIYSNDWGSFNDVVTALGAGFLGQVTVNWGLLPVFRSTLLRVVARAE